jgi:hypothetical protein
MQLSAQTVLIKQPPTATINAVPFLAVQQLSLRNNKIAVHHLQVH